MADDDAAGREGQRVAAALARQGGKVLLRELASAVSPIPGTGALVEGLFDYLSDALPRHAAERRASREEGLTLGLAIELAQTGLGADELGRDPAFVDAIAQAHRTAMEAIDPGVAPVLGRLTAWYRGKPLDPFFRGAARTLRDLTSGDLEELVRMMALGAATASHDAYFNRDTVSIHIDEQTGRFTANRGLMSQHLEMKYGTPSSPEVWRRIWVLLVAHHLAELGDYDGEDLARMQHTLLIPLETVQHFHRLLGSPPP